MALDSHIGPRAKALGPIWLPQCQYDLEAHLGHIIICNYSTVPCFILLAFRSFMTPIERKISRKTGSHYDYKSYSAMLKSVESKKYTLSARHHHMRQCQKSILMPQVHEYGNLASLCDNVSMDSANGKYYGVLTAILLCKL